MPEFIYAGQVPTSYTETRDSGGFVIGTVEHGDTRDFGEPDTEAPEGAPGFWPAPDGRWVPAGTEIGAAWDGVGAGMYRLPEPAAGAADSQVRPRDLAPGEVLEDASGDLPAGSAIPGGRIHPGYGEPTTGVEHPADGTWSPAITSDAPPAEPGGETTTASAELSGASGEEQ